MSPGKYSRPKRNRRKTLGNIFGGGGGGGGGGVNKVPYRLCEIGEILACDRALHLWGAASPFVRAFSRRTACSQPSEIQGVLSLGRTAHPVFIPDSLTDSVSRK